MPFLPAPSSMPPCVVSAKFTSIISLACFLFKDPATPEIYTLSLHDALPISGDPIRSPPLRHHAQCPSDVARRRATSDGDRKSTRLNSSHVAISYAVFCLKKKKRDRRHQVARALTPESPSIPQACTSSAQYRA